MHGDGTGFHRELPVVVAGTRAPPFRIPFVSTCAALPVSLGVDHCIQDVLNDLHDPFVKACFQLLLA